MTAESMKACAPIVDLFFKHGVIKVDSSAPFVLSSGARSPIYLDHRRAFSPPRLRQLLVDAWADVLSIELRALGLHATDVVCVGTATAGIAPAMALAQKWNCEFLYVRQKPKGHGMQQMVEGEFIHSKPHVVIDDMLTTGQSLFKSVDVLRQLETKMVLCSTITSHGLAAAHRLFEQAHLPFKSLFETHQILTQAHALGLISRADLRTVMAWLEQLNTPSDRLD